MDYVERQLKPNTFGFSPSGARDSMHILDIDLNPPPENRFVKKEKELTRRELINKLNHIHFQGRSILVNFKRIRDDRIISLAAYPHPCFGRHMVCLWAESPDMRDVSNACEFEDFTITEGPYVITAYGQLRAVNSRGICITLPETVHQSSCRKVRRFSCDALNVQLVQNSVVFSGSLMDFSPLSFGVEIQPSSKEPFNWLNLQDKLNMIISREGETIFSGECRIIRQAGGPQKKQIILEPLTDTIQRFNPKAYRSKRLQLIPSPDIRFIHPFTGQPIKLKVIDVSGAGISVEDDEENSVLLPGMIIPAMALLFTNSFSITCRTQVVYRKPLNGASKDSAVKCGIAFLDMNPQDHMRLLAILHQAENRNLYVCSDVNMDDLWRFFFESGFIYPRKYAFIHEQKDRIKSTYEKLYTTPSNIARYFTWQRKGVIQGHLSMLRFYDKTWLIHHLAALKTEQGVRIGLEMLKQIGSFTYDSYRLFSSHMDYLMCYFRPENYFPNHFFGGVAKNINEPKSCSIDIFAYVHFHNSTATPYAESAVDWSLTKATYEDLVELEVFYNRVSGGLMLSAFDLIPEKQMTERNDLADEYRKLGLTRMRLMYALKVGDILKAVIMINISDLALNLSDLTNCITIYIIDSEDLSPYIIQSAVFRLSDQYGMRKFPTLIYPSSYTETQSLHYEKNYHLWILDMHFSDDYFKHLEHLI